VRCLGNKELIEEGWGERPVPIRGHPRSMDGGIYFLIKFCPENIANNKVEVIYCLN